MQQSHPVCFHFILPHPIQVLCHFGFPVTPCLSFSCRMCFPFLFQSSPTMSYSFDSLSCPGPLSCFLFSSWLRPYSALPFSVFTFLFLGVSCKPPCFFSSLSFHHGIPSVLSCLVDSCHFPCVSSLCFMLILEILPLFLLSLFILQWFISRLFS